MSVTSDTFDFVSNHIRESILQLDKDLQTLQEVRNLCESAKAAQRIFKESTQEEIDRVVAAMAEAGFKAAEHLAKLAVRETGYGNVPDKIKKNQFATRDIYETIRNLRTVGVINDDRKRKLLEIAEPFGVVAGIIPTTNPTSTAMFKILISLKTRNAIVISPHPRARQSILEAANILADAARQAGAPEGLIGTIATPSLAATQELMRHEYIDVILATGGPGLVSAAYSAGKPAYGVGPGNVPAYIDRSADCKKAVNDVIAGKTFDYGTLCSSEQAMIVDAPLASRAKQALAQGGGHLLNAEEAAKLAGVLITGKHAINPAMVGKSPQHLAQAAGITIPENTRLLVAELAGVGDEHPLSMEKLSPTLAFYAVNGYEEGIRRSVEILCFGGRGHTAAIHAKDDAVVRQFGLAVPASRVIVNSPASVGAVGYTNELTPSLTLGCGSRGRNITSDNISAHHLMNIKRVAYETRPYAEVKEEATWRSTIRHDWRNREAPYNKALSSSVSRKGGAAPEAQKAEPATPADAGTSFGASGMTEAEVEQVVTEFLKNRN